MVPLYVAVTLKSDSNVANTMYQIVKNIPMLMLVIFVMVLLLQNEVNAEPCFYVDSDSQCPAGWSVDDNGWCCEDDANNMIGYAHIE